MDSARELYQALMAYDGAATYSDLLRPWLANNRADARWIRDFGNCQGSPIPAADYDDLFRLYALSRVFETLLLRFQNGEADGSNWPGPALTVAEYTTFADATGLKVVQPTRYTPFHHEVVAVEACKDPLAAPVLLANHWPCLMIGNMLFMRAGVTVLAAEHQLAPGIADVATIYWSHRRKNRPTNDLSHGWGSNSQWRTCFCRDYQIRDTYFFNVDGKSNLKDLPNNAIDDSGLSKSERMELLVNRSFVVTKKPHGDLCPYDDTISVSEFR